MEIKLISIGNTYKNKIKQLKMYLCMESAFSRISKCTNRIYYFVAVIYSLVGLFYLS